MSSSHRNEKQVWILGGGILQLKAKKGLTQQYYEQKKLRIIVSFLAKT